MSNYRPLAAAFVGFGLAAFTVTGVASAHANTVACVDQATSTWRITNDYPLAESFTSPQGPAGNVAAGNGSYTDVVYVGDSLQIDAVWSDGFTESRTGTGDCTPEGGTTTTAAETTTTELVTTTTEQGSTTSVLETTTTTTEPLSTSTTELVTTTSTTPEATTTLTPTSTTQPTNSSTSSSTTPLETTTTSPPSVPSTSLPPECSDNPNTPQDDCAPICVPVTLDDGTNSCSPPLPATGSNTVGIIVAAWIVILAGIVALGYGAAQRER